MAKHIIYPKVYYLVSSSFGLKSCVIPWANLLPGQVFRLLLLSKYSQNATYLLNELKISGNPSNTVVHGCKYLLHTNTSSIIRCVTTKPNFCTKNMIVHACQKTQWTQTFLNSYNRAKNRNVVFVPRNRENILV